jgi:flagellar hook-associated protein 2
MVSIDGLVSGLDTTSIINALLKVHQTKIDLLNAQKSKLSAQQQAFKSIEAHLLTLQSSTTLLASSVLGVFRGRVATVSDETILKAAPQRNAPAGSYQLTVLQLARNHQLASQGYASPQSKITQGTLQIRVGTGTAATITIDSSNDTLEGLAAAINAAGVGVQASLIHDGSDDSTQPYRLLLSAVATGAANKIEITNNLGADTGDAVRPVFAGTYIGPANLTSDFTGSSRPTSNREAGAYTGTDNDTYTFTVRAGGTVGTDSGIIIDYTDGSGDHSGSITLDATDVDTFKAVAEGLQVKFSAGTLNAGDRFTVDVYVTELQQPQNARVALGSGPAALVVESARNTLDQLVPGTTIELLAAEPTRTVTVTVAPDAERAKQAIEDFVDAFNELMDFVDEQIRYDPQTNTGGPLLGEFAAVQVQEQVRRVVVEPVAGLTTGLRVLSDLGIRLTDAGRLQMDSSQLEDVLNGRVPGVTWEDIERLFALYGKSTNSGIRFVTGSAHTRASETPYEVDITQAAEQARITATNAAATTLVIDGTNNTFRLRLDGKDSGDLEIPVGTYTREELARALEALINQNSTLRPSAVSVTVEVDRFVLTSQRYGSDSEVKILGGTSLATLGFSGSEEDKGTDVAGFFIVNGVVEPAVGRGQLLSGVDRNAYTADLQLRVVLTPSQVAPGVDGTIHVTRGIASQMGLTLSALLDPVDGRLRRIDQRFSDQMEDLDQQIARQQDALETRREELIARFAALEQILSRLQSLNALMAAQLQSLVAR